MILNDVISLENNYNHIPDNKSILNFSLKLKNAKIYTLYVTNFSEEISILNDKVSCSEVEKSNLIILSEPSAKVLEESELKKFKSNYKEIIVKAKSLNIEIVHIVTNNNWFMIFQELISLYNIPVYLRNKDYSYLKSYLEETEFHIIDDFLYLKDFHHYSNEITENLLIDLTSFQDVDNFYTQTINAVFDVVPNFENVTILLSDDSYLPNIDSEKVKVCYESKGVSVDSYTY